MKSKKVLSVAVSFLVFAAAYPKLHAGAVVTCGSAGDGYRCHYMSSVGTPPPMYHTFGDKVMNGGIGQYGNNRRYYWRDTAFASSYTTPIDTAVSEWVNTTSAVGVTTSISIRETTTRSAAYFEVVRDDSLGAGVLGTTDFFFTQRPCL